MGITNWCTKRALDRTQHIHQYHLDGHCSWQRSADFLHDPSLSFGNNTAEDFFATKLYLLIKTDQDGGLNTKLPSKTIEIKANSYQM